MPVEKVARVVRRARRHSVPMACRASDAAADPGVAATGDPRGRAQALAAQELPVPATTMAMRATTPVPTGPGRPGPPTRLASRATGAATTRTRPLIAV